MRQINISGTKEQIDDWLDKLKADGEAQIGTGDTPIRPDKTLEICLRETDDEDPDEEVELYYHETEV